MTADKYTRAPWQTHELGRGARLYCLDGLLEPARADACFRQWQTTLDWQQPRVRVYGREHPVPRLTAWYGQPGLAYRYSGQTHLAQGWQSSGLEPLLDAITRATGLVFNAVLANLYRHGQDTMGYHSDDEPELGEHPWVASYSLGQPRDFVFRPKHGHRRRQCYSLTLAHNQLLLMNPAVQHGFQHALPRRTRQNGPRINLTFRQVKNQ